MRYTLSNEKHDLKHDFRTLICISEAKSIANVIPAPTLIKEKTRDTSSTGELP